MLIFDQKSKKCQFSLKFVVFCFYLKGTKYCTF